MNQKRILVAEDDPIASMVMLRHLTILGYNAKAAMNGREALKILALDAFDLVLMDCQMPDIDGFGAARLIRKNQIISKAGKPLPIVAVTSLTTHGIEQKCIEAGMNFYLPKPVNPGRLAETILKCLAVL